MLLLFFSAFVAATIFPAQSELVLLAMASDPQNNKWHLLAVASVGNVLGSVVNWLLGVYLIHFKDKKWFPFKEKSILKAEKIYNKYGHWSLLFAWLPFIGDPLTLIAGIFRVNFLWFIMLVAIGKISRYAFLLIMV